jgi:hypothetical protein
VSAFDVEVDTGHSDVAHGQRVLRYTGSANAGEEVG